MWPRWTRVIPGIAAHGLRSGVCQTANARVAAVAKHPRVSRRAAAGSAISM